MSALYDSLSQYATKHTTPVDIAIYSNGTWLITYEDETQASGINEDDLLEQLNIPLSPTELNNILQTQTQPNALLIILATMNDLGYQAAITTYNNL